MIITNTRATCSTLSLAKKISHEFNLLRSGKLFLREIVGSDFFLLVHSVIKSGSNGKS